MIIKKNINQKFQSLAEKLNNITWAIEILSPDAAPVVIESWPVLQAPVFEEKQRNSSLYDNQA